MSKGHICIRNYMNIVAMGLHYDHINLFSFAIIIIALVTPKRSTTLDQFSVSQLREKRNTSQVQRCQIGHFCGQIKVINRSFVAFGCHSLLWPKDTVFLSP